MGRHSIALCRAGGCGLVGPRESGLLRQARTVRACGLRLRLVRDQPFCRHLERAAALFNGASAPRCRCFTHLSLTVAGHHLAALPVDARVGKLLLLSASLGCLAPALTIAACLRCGGAASGCLKGGQDIDAAPGACPGQATPDSLGV